MLASASKRSLGQNSSLGPTGSTASATMTVAEPKQSCYAEHNQALQQADLQIVQITSTATLYSLIYCSSMQFTDTQATMYNRAYHTTPARQPTPSTRSSDSHTSQILSGIPHYTSKVAATKAFTHTCRPLVPSNAVFPAQAQHEN